MTPFRTQHVQGHTIYSGRHWRLVCGDWRRSKHLLEPAEGGWSLPADHIITDGPYTDHVSAKQRTGSKLETHALSFGGIKAADIVPPLLRCARRWFIGFCAIEQVGNYHDAAGGMWPDGSFVRGGVWIKSNPTPQFSGDRPGMWGESLAIMHAHGEGLAWNGREVSLKTATSHPGGDRGREVGTGLGMPAIWKGPSAKGDERFHETQKPLWLMLALIDEFTDGGETIWDPYAGSGTTGVACLLRGRNFVGHEINPEYALKAAERLHATTQGLTRTAYLSGQGSLLAAVL